MGVKFGNYLEKHLKSALTSLLQTFCSNEVVPTRHWRKTLVLYRMRPTVSAHPIQH